MAASTYKDALDLLTQDHRSVKELFEKFKGFGDWSSADKQDTVELICEMLTNHAELEEEIFYPKVREEVKGAEEMVSDAEEEHDSVKELIEEIRELDMDEDGEIMDTKVKILIEEVEKHVAEEEWDMFPLVRKSNIDLVALGQEMAEYKDDLEKPLF